MDELAQVYARSLFQVALEQGKLDVLREQLGQFADAVARTANSRCSSSRPTSRAPRSSRHSGQLLEGADENFLNFLSLLIENHRMPVIFRIRQEYERLWDEENKTLPVEIN